jgi:hypothetical protein
MTSDIYCPDPIDLQNKMVMMAQGDYSWETESNEVVIHLDLSHVTLNTVTKYAGGMGLRINNTPLKIQQVFIDGKKHYGYNDNVILLPNLTKSVSELKIVLGEISSTEPHLQYVSKRMPQVKKSGDDLEVKLLTKSKARFGFYVPAGSIVLNADWFEWNRKGDHRLNGYVTSDRKITLKQLETRGLVFYYSDFLISKINENESEIVLSLIKKSEDRDKLFQFSSVKAVQSIQLNNQSVEHKIFGDHYVLKLNLAMGENKLRIRF